MLKEKHSYIGIIIILSSIILIIGLNFLKGGDIFKTTNTYFVKYDNINGLQKSNPITLRGMVIGRVDDIFFDKKEADQIIVKLQIENKYKIADNSTAKITSTNIMGGKQISLTLGKSTMYLENKAFINGDSEDNIMDKISSELKPLGNKAGNLFENLDKLASSINDILDKDTKTNISKTIKNLENTSNQLSTLITHRNSKLNMLLSNLESISKNLNTNSGKINNIVSNFDKIGSSLSEVDFKTSIDETKNTIKQFNKIISEINSGNGSIGKLIKDESLYNNLTHASINLSSLLSDMNNNPKRYIHFSIFDTGKTNYNNKLPYNSDKQYYSICVLESQIQISKNNNIYTRFKNLKEIQNENMYIYIIEKSDNLEKITKHLKDILKDYPRSKIINSTYLPSSKI